MLSLIWETVVSVGDGQGGLACCDSRGLKESDMAERLNWTELSICVLQIMFSSVQLLSCVQLSDPMDCSIPGFPVHTNSRSLLKLMSIKLVMPSNHFILCSSPSPPAFTLSQHQGLFQRVSSSYQVAKVLELQLQHQSFQWIFMTAFL